MKACINGNWLAYDDIGYGPAVVLIHSFPLCRQMWRPQIEALSDQGFRVIAPDLRGFGDSTSCDDQFDLTTMTDDICRLMTYLGIGRAAMVGISTAGGLLLDLLERYPQRVAATCFLSPSMRPDDASGHIRRFDLAELVREGHRATATDSLCERLLSGPSSPIKQTLMNQLRSWIKLSSPVALASSLEAKPMRLCSRDENQLYPVPTLIVTGDRDRVMPGHDLPEPLNGLRKVVNGAGHLVNLEAPEVVNRLLLGFLQNLSTIKRHHRLQKVA